MSSKFKTISVVIREDQHEKLHDMGVNISGYIRDAIDDRISDHRVTLSVSDETRRLYDKVISDTGRGDAELEAHFRDALKSFLKAKIREMQELSAHLEEE